MWKAVVGYEQEISRTDTSVYPLQVRIILVGGDGGYLETIEDLLETYNKHEPRLDLDIVVYAWKNTLHSAYRALAAEHRATLRNLDDIQGFSLHKKKESAL
jgi:hypothetical protein